MENNPIQSLWVRGRLTTMEKLCIKSFLENGHEFHLYTYDEVSGVPGGAIIRDGREILSEDKIFTYQTEGFGEGELAGFADWFRYVLLYKKGGWWVDTDVVCTKKFDFEKNKIMATTYTDDGRPTASNCVMKLPKEDELLKYCIDICENIRVDKIDFGDTGPVLVKKGIERLGLQSYTVPPHVFCPINYHYFEDLVSPPIGFWKRLKRRFWHSIPVGRIRESTHSVHLYNQMWKDAGLDKEGTYPPGSIYEKLKRRYLSVEESVEEVQDSTAR